MLDYSDHYREIEDGLASLLAVDKTSWPSKRVEDIEEFIEAREYGLALEAISWILLMNRVVPRDEVVHTISYLASSMNLYNEKGINTLLDRFQRRPPPAI